jgi:L-rhamnose isomerase/sugar isomerase
LDEYQDANDALMAANTLKIAYNTDVSPILAVARQRSGGAIDPIATFRAADYRQQLASARPAASGSSSGIV